MHAELILIVLLLSTPVCLCAGHAIWTRILRRRSVAPQLVAVSCVAVGNLPVLWIGWSFALKELCRTPLDVFYGLLYLLVTYNGFGFCYFHLLNASETSLHLHIMMTLLVEGDIRSEDLAARYGAEDMIGARIQRMIALDQLKERDGYFILNSRGLILVGRIINIWRRILGLPLNPT